jgi:hypothetical protein
VCEGSEGFDIIETFICRECKKVIPVALKCSGNGNLCKLCRKEQDLIRHYVNGISIRLIVHLIKSGLGCQRCGKFLSDYQIDFHHVGEKKYSMGLLISKGRIDLFLSELPKCVLLCSQCHREEHYGGRKLPYNIVMEDSIWS